MAARFSVTGSLKAMWSRMQLDTKLLLMLGVLATLVVGLVRDDDSCRVGLVLAFVREPPEIFEEVSVSDAEKSHMTTIVVDGKAVTRPFGFINDEWEELKRRYEKGDCLYHYRVDCGVLCGGGGYLLIRDGRVIDSIQTWIS